jgi:hypothetical protein
MAKEAQDKKSRLEFTVKFVENVKATDKEQRFTDAQTPVFPCLTKRWNS